MKPKLKPPGTKRLKLKCDIPLSTFALNFNLCREITVDLWSLGVILYELFVGRGLHSSTFQLILSAFGRIRWVVHRVLVTKRLRLS